MWLAFRRRHSADRRARHGLEASAECYLCDQAQETIHPLLCECPFTREVWFHTCQALGLPLSHVAHSVPRWWRRQRGSAQADKWRGLDSLFALIGWEIWKERNARCFRQTATSVPQLLLVIKAQADLSVQAGANHLRSVASGVALREFQFLLVLFRPFSRLLVS
jgi:hypothetical protein